MWFSCVILSSIGTFTHTHNTQICFLTFISTQLFFTFHVQACCLQTFNITSQTHISNSFKYDSTSFHIGLWLYFCKFPICKQMIKLIDTLKIDRSDDLYAIIHWIDLNCNDASYKQIHRNQHTHTHAHTLIQLEWII